jgi:phosphatidate cytidylyltransferase
LAEIPAPKSGAPGEVGPTPRAPGRPLLQAAATAIVLLGLVALAYAVGPRALFGLICVVVAVAMFELLDALRRARRRPVIGFGVVCALGLLTSAYAGRALWMVAVAAVALFGSLLLALRPDRGPTPASDAAWTVLAVAWIGGGGAAAAALVRTDPGGPSLLMASVLVVALDDIVAYFAGTRFGGHKMAPSISPSKSWEGFAAGATAALVGGAVAGGLLQELAWPHGLGLGLVCALFAPAGDLVESVVKRELGIKDSGGSLPGHGGFLDRVDAIVFCAPALLLYVRVVVG